MERKEDLRVVKPRVFSAIALTAFRYVLEGGDGRTMDDVRAGMQGYLRASSKALAAFK